MAAAQGRARPAGARAWSLIGVLAVTNATVAFAAMFAGVDGLATGTAAVLANAQPLLILLPAWWLYGERVTARTSVGLVVGFAGLLVVAVPGGGGSGAWLSILAATAITAGTLLSRRLAGIDLVQAAGWHFLIGGAVLAAVAGAVEGLPRIDWTPRFALSLAFLALVGTALAFWAWFTEAMRCPLGQLAAWTFLTPVFGIGFGVLLTSEYPGRWAVAGMVLILASLWTVVRSSARHRRCRREGHSSSGHPAPGRARRPVCWPATSASPISRSARSCATRWRADPGSASGSRHRSRPGISCPWSTCWTCCTCR